MNSLGVCAFIMVVLGVFGLLLAHFGRRRKINVRLHHNEYARNGRSKGDIVEVDRG